VPAKWVVRPGGGPNLTFEEAPKHYEEAGLMPSYAAERLLAGAEEAKPAFNVRPSDITPRFACRRQRVWQTTHDYGVDPLALEAMEEGSALHAAYGAMEIEVPEQVYGRVDFKETQRRLNVCGVPMRGRIDWLFPERIEDLKTSTPFWIARFPTKEQKLVDSSLRPFADIWIPKDQDDDIQDWKIQLSIYRVLLEKEGKIAPTKGRVWKRWSGVKDGKKRWTRFDFDLLDEAGLEELIGPWTRELARGLQAAMEDPEAWKGVPADGREMVGSRGMWKCDPCPLKEACFTQDRLEVF